VGSFVPVLPFLLIADRMSALVTTLAACFIALAILGVYLGKVSRESLLKTAAEIVIIGVIISAISLLIGGSH
jgi:predicted membrane protein (TIGR00267 family)